MFEPIIIGKIASNASTDSNRWSIMKINRSPITTFRGICHTTPSYPRPSQNNNPFYLPHTNRTLLFLNGHIPPKLTGKKLVFSLDVLSINNSEFENWLDQMYLVDLEIKDTTDNNISASYLDFLLSVNFILPCMTSATVSASTLKLAIPK